MIRICSSVSRFLVYCAWLILLLNILVVFAQVTWQSSIKSGIGTVDRVYYLSHFTPLVQLQCQSNASVWRPSSRRTEGRACECRCSRIRTWQAHSVQRQWSCDVQSALSHEDNLTSRSSRARTITYSMLSWKLVAMGAVGMLICPSGIETQGNQQLVNSLIFQRYFKWIDCEYVVIFIVSFCEKETLIISITTTNNMI